MIRYTLEPWIQEEGRALEGLDMFVRLDFLAYSISKNLDDYSKLVSELPLSELIKFCFYEGLRSGS